MNLLLALRSWRKTPRLTLTLVACIAISIAGSSTVLTFVYSLLVRPLPYPEPARLVMLEPSKAGPHDVTRPYISYPNFVDLRSSVQSFELFEAATVSRLIVQTAGGSERLRGETVTPGYFSLFGAQPMLGRTFTADEFAGRGPRAIVLSSRIWRTRFAADPSLIGQPISTRVGPAVLVGVMPEKFLGVAEDEGTDYWIAEGQNLHAMMVTERRGPTTLVFGRLKNGVALAQAGAEMRSALASLVQAHPEINRGLDARIIAFGEKWRAPLRSGLVTMLVGSLFLLAIGCGNVAILLLARLVSREREMAVRLSLGASRGDLLRLLFAESLVLAIAGGAAGLLLSAGLNDLFVKVAGIALPTHLPVDFGPAPMIVCASLVLLTGFAVGLLPAAVAARIDSAAALRTGGRGLASNVLQGRSGRFLVIAQTALAVALLAGAALFLRSYDKLRHADFGYRTENLLRYQVSLQREQHATPDAIESFWRNMTLELEALPGVRRTALLAPTLPPYDATDAQISLKGGHIGGAAAELPVNLHFASNEVFDILEVPLREGRLFTAADRRGGPSVALVSESLARKLAPGGSAVGRVILHNNTEVEVVGVVADARWNGQRNRTPSGLNLFLPLQQYPQLSVGVLFDTVVPPETAIDPVRKAVLARDPTAALHWIDTMEQALDFQTVNERFWTVLTGAYAVTAFLLAALGLYGVLAHGVASRLREIGIRMALGATANAVARMVVAQGLRLVGAGLLCGLALAVGMGRWIESRLYGTSAYDPFALASVAALLLVAATLICWLPARRAAKTDPMEALRAE